MYTVFYTVWDYGYAMDIPVMINLKTRATIQQNVIQIRKHQLYILTSSSKNDYFQHTDL